MELATLWERTRAIILDLIIISILQTIINLTFGSERITNAVVDPSTSGGFSSFSSTTEVDGIWLWLAAMLYFSLQEGLFGATLGKAVVAIRVTDMNGRRPGWRPILIRNLFRVIDSFPGIYLVGAIAFRFSPRSQRIGDRWAGTLVVPARAVAAPWLTPEQRRDRQRLVGGIVAVLLVVCLAFSYFGRPPIVLGNLARTGQFPAGRVSSYQHGPAQWNGGSIMYPVTYTLASSGKRCAGTITLDWHGFLPGWELSAMQSNC